MRIFNRGQTINFNETFYDSTGGIAAPTSVYVAISYPTSGFPFRGCMTSTTATLTRSTATGAYTGSWDSRGSWIGTVWYSVHANDVTLAVKDGQFELRGNPANLTVTTTT